jgi:hypothetical protein
MHALTRRSQLALKILELLFNVFHLAVPSGSSFVEATRGRVCVTAQMPDDLLDMYHGALLVGFLSWDILPALEHVCVCVCVCVCACVRACVRACYYEVPEPTPALDITHKQSAHGCQVAIASNDSTVSLQATILLADLMNSASSILPPSITLQYNNLSILTLASTGRGACLYVCMYACVCVCVCVCGGGGRGRGGAGAQCLVKLLLITRTFAQARASSKTAAASSSVLFYAI